MRGLGFSTEAKVSNLKLPRRNCGPVGWAPAVPVRAAPPPGAGGTLGVFGLGFGLAGLGFRLWGGSRSSGPRAIELRVLRGGLVSFRISDI